MGLEGEIPRVVDPDPIARLDAVRHFRVRAESEGVHVAGDAPQGDTLACGRAARDHEIGAGQVACGHTRQLELPPGPGDHVEDGRLVPDPRGRNR